MARRARRVSRPTQILVIAAILVALGGLAYVVASRSSDKFAGHTPLPVGEYMRNANSLSGNSYKMTGEVNSKARYLRTTARSSSSRSRMLGTSSISASMSRWISMAPISIGGIRTRHVEVRSGGVLALLELQQ